MHVTAHLGGDHDHHPVGSVCWLDERVMGSDKSNRDRVTSETIYPNGAVRFELWGRSGVETRVPHSILCTFFNRAVSRTGLNKDWSTINDVA